jgi:hypothetical protein
VVKVIVPVKEEIMRAAERRKDKGLDGEISQFLAELIDLGFEHRFQQIYKKFEAGEISLEFFAMELGFNIRDIYAELEKRELPTSNIKTQISVGKQ